VEQFRTSLVYFYEVVRNLGSSWKPIRNEGNSADATQVKKYLKEIKQRLELGKVSKQSLTLLYRHMDRFGQMAECEITFGIAGKNMFRTIFQLMWSLFLRAEEVSKFNFGDDVLGLVTSIRTE
jgi:hypothetical protein